VQTDGFREVRDANLFVLVSATGSIEVDSKGAVTVNEKEGLEKRFREKISIKQPGSEQSFVVPRVERHEARRFPHIV
jgi:hypothetical protein